MVIIVFAQTYIDVKMNKQELKKKIKDYISFFETLEAKRLLLLGRYYHRDARFKDPFHDVEGAQNIRNVFEKIYNQTSPKIRYAHYGLSEDGVTALLRWDYMFELKSGKQVISGTTELTFDKDGLIVSQIDYWDPSEAVYEKVPVLRSLVRMVKRKLCS